MDDKTATGDDFIRILLATYLTSIPPTYCWVDDTNLGTFEYKLSYSSIKQSRVANVIFHFDDEENSDSRMGLEFEKCTPGYKDCLIWCSKSNCETPGDFENRRIISQRISYAEDCNDGYVKKDSFCYPKCELIGMVTCEEGVCASSENACKLKRPSFTYELIESYVDFLGHIYSLKSNTTFGWSDPESFDSYKSLLVEKYYNQDKDRLREIANIVSRNGTNIIEMMYKKSLQFLKSGKDNPAYQAFFQTISNNIKYSLFNTNIEDISREIFFNIENLGNCVLENWTNDDGTVLQWWTPHEKKDPKKTDCNNAVYRLIVKLKPYLLIGFVNGITKPLCPFISIKN